ncbi:hypothetical protein Ciccas_000338 [Cichlidogyrus casuarinus]|uniref:Kinesin-like KIF1-type domain-containing protein n=1 Tax=Cichlidogyrus casuarinus TaxID=1844966 RepID=A0ABD2QN62_9PLAT
MTCKVSDLEWYWERGKFLNRRYMMQEYYQNYLHTGEKSKLEKESSDPFWEPNEVAIVGTVPIFLQAVGYRLDFEDTVNIHDYEGLINGELKFHIVPCTKSGKAIDVSEAFLDDPNELLNQNICFKTLKILNNKHYFGLSAKFQFLDSKPIQSLNFGDYPTNGVTCMILKDQKHVLGIEGVTKQQLAMFQTGYLNLLIMSKQIPLDKRPIQALELNSVRKRWTMIKVLPFQIRPPINAGDLTSHGGRRYSTITVDDMGDMNKVKTDLAIMQRRCDKYEKTEGQLQSLVEKYKSKAGDLNSYKELLQDLERIAKSSRKNVRCMYIFKCI